MQAQRDNFSKESNKIKKKIGDEFLLPENPEGNRNLLTVDTALSIKDYDGAITEKEENIENLREGIQRRIDRNLGIMHKLAITVIKDDINNIVSGAYNLNTGDGPSGAGTFTAESLSRGFDSEEGPSTSSSYEDFDTMYAKGGIVSL